MTQKQIISISILALVLLGGYIIYTRNNNSAAPTNTETATSTTNSSTTTSTTTLPNGVTISSEGGSGYTVEQVPIENNKAPVKPDLNRGVTFKASLNLSAEVKASITEKIKGLQTELKKDGTTIANWINLGLYQKSAGDYEGAALSWKYVSKISSDDYVSLGNLGDLYGYYLKDNAMSETYYKEAIGRGPKISYLYVHLAEVYRDVFVDKAKAKATIEQGFVKIPNDPSLLEFKATLE